MINYFLHSTLHVITVLPFVIALTVALCYLLPSRMARRTKFCWLIFLVFCAMRGFAYVCLGGNAQAPELPEKLIWFWDWAFSGMVFLAGFSLVWWIPRGRKWLLPIAAWGLAAVGFANAIVLPEPREIEVASDRVPIGLDGYRIAFLTDLHCSDSMRGWRTRGIVERVNAAKPDLICVGGDLVDGSVARLSGDLEPITGLDAPDGVCWVTGNHEGYFDWKLWRKWYREHGIRFMANECRFPRKGLAVGGVNDYQYARKTKDLKPDAAKAFAAATNGEFRVYLCHQPRNVRADIESTGIDLALCGHTHGGLIPGVSGVIAGKNGGYVRGLYTVGSPGRRPSQGILYVSPGVGQWCGFPLRLFNESEISVIVLRRTASVDRSNQ